MKFLQRGILIFVIGLCGSLSAQTLICTGDSVVIVLDGYKQGVTSWEQSSDQTNWSKASGNSYNDSLLIVATSTLYYRATVTDSTCSSPFYSDTILVAVRSVPPPTAKPASNITLLSFDASWDYVNGATTYYLDVATDAGFNSFVPGYHNLTVNNDKTYRVTGVSCETIYYYRVRVHDDTCGISGNSDTIAVTTPVCPVYCTYNKSTCNGNITDSRDSKNYKTVQIGSKCWMEQNLNVGTAIQGEVPQTQNNTSIEKYCYGYSLVGGDSSKCATYGGLYQWGEMMAYGPSVGGDSIGPQGICPTGWHIPTNNEWKCLEMTLDMTKAQADLVGYHGTTEGNKLKTIGNGAPPLWSTPSEGTNVSNFSALPSGALNDGNFAQFGNCTQFHTATESTANQSWMRTLWNNRADVSSSASTPKIQGGYSVRCVKD